MFVWFGCHLFTVLSVNMHAIVFLENIMCYTKSFFPKEKSNFKFSKYINRFRKCQILLTLGAHIYTDFLKALIFMGILIASSAACVSLKMYGKIHILTYMLFPSLTVICVVDAVVLTYLGNIPYQQTVNFGSFWRLLLTKKEDRRQLKSSKPSGFDLGPYGLCTLALGLRICDDYINNTFFYNFVRFLLNLWIWINKSVNPCLLVGINIYCQFET